jgi:OOP family OmpA-OmpF porin
MRRALLLLVSLWLAAPSAAAQERRYDLERFRPAPDPDGFLTITGTRTPGPLRYDFGAALGYAGRQLLLRDTATGETLGVVSDRFFGDLTFQLGLGGIFAVGIDAPFVLSQVGDGAAIDGAGPLPSAAIRDPRISGRMRLLGEDATVDRERHEGEGLAVQAAITLPIGQERSFAGEGAPQLEAELLGDFHLLDIGIGGVLGFRHRFAEPTVADVSFRNQLYFGVGLQVPSFVLEQLVSIAEVDVTTDLENPFGNVSSTVVEWRLGLRARLGDLAITAMGGSGLVGGVGSPSVRGVLGVTWSPRVHDRDHDGLVDDRDECPSLPEDFDAYEDENGCPEPDNDRDLVPDLDDACPDEAAELDRDLDDDGCTDPLLDRDGDALADDVDACPDVAEDVDGVDDADGCPDLDEDHDGVEMPIDRCPEDPEDRDEHEDGDGCPDRDDDVDGVPDAQDLCPREAEDSDSVEPTDGCPEPA